MSKRKNPGTWHFSERELKDMETEHPVSIQARITGRRKPFYTTYLDKKNGENEERKEN